MPRGCILVIDTATGEVLASVSMPTFDPRNIAASIRADDTSLINRPLRAFSAGSVFKVVLAAAAYESGLDWYTHDCTGELELAGQTYRCAQGRAHGEVNLRGALEQSCNTYFIELGQLLGLRASCQRRNNSASAQRYSLPRACGARRVHCPMRRPLQMTDSWQASASGRGR